MRGVGGGIVGLLVLAAALGGTATTASAAWQLGAQPGARASRGSLTEAKPCSVSPTSTALGSAVGASGTIKNRSSSNITLRRVVLAGRLPGQPNVTSQGSDFQPVRESVTIGPGRSYTLHANQTISGNAPIGTWRCYLTYQTQDGAWHDGASADVTVSAGTGPSAGTLLGGAPPAGSGAPQLPGRHYGILATSISYIARQYSVGFRQASWDISWAAYEPAPGSFDAGYASSVKSSVDAFKKAGMGVSLSINLGHSTPQWVLDLPNGRLQDQFGDRDGANFMWSQAARNAANAYLRRVIADFGPSYFYAIRIGFASDAGEMLYSQSIRHPNSLWAFDPIAQQGGADLPSTAKSSPMPGWRPGDRTWSGQPVSTAQVDEWYRWYVGGLTDAGNWEASTLSAAGFTGWYQWLFPTEGVLPSAYSGYVSSYLTSASTFPGDARPRGGVWQLIIPGIVDKAHAQVQNSGIANGGGGNSPCSAADDSMVISDPQIDGWSGGRWTSYLADLNGHMVKTAENPGQHDSVAAVQAANRIFLSCHMQIWYFSHDFSLFDRTASAAQLRDVAGIIASSGGA